MKAGFKIKSVTVQNGGFEYRTHRLAGWLNGQRIREQFKSRAEAEGRKNELEVKAANIFWRAFSFSWPPTRLGGVVAPVG